MTFLEFLSVLFMVVGSVFLLVGVFGNIRLPDFYSRLHVAGMHDALGVGMIIIGAAMSFNKTLITFKLIMLVAFLIFTAAISSHALSMAAFDSKLKPMGSKDNISMPTRKKAAKKGKNG